MMPCRVFRAEERVSGAVPETLSRSNRAQARISLSLGPGMRRCRASNIIRLHDRLPAVTYFGAGMLMTRIAIALRMPLVLCTFSISIPSVTFHFIFLAYPCYQTGCCFFPASLLC